MHSLMQPIPNFPKPSDYLYNDKSMSLNDSSIWMQYKLQMHLNNVLIFNYSPLCQNLSAKVKNVSAAVIETSFKLCVTSKKISYKYLYIKYFSEQLVIFVSPFTHSLTFHNICMMKYIFYFTISDFSPKLNVILLILISCLLDLTIKVDVLLPNFPRTKIPQISNIFQK